jgi:hypothetical protein
MKPERCAVKARIRKRLGRPNTDLQCLKTTMAAASGN